MISSYRRYPSFWHAGLYVTADIDSSFSLHIFPEGFGTKDSFTAAVKSMFKQLVTIAPFNLLEEDNSFNFSSYEYWLDDKPNSADLAPYDLGTIPGSTPAPGSLPSHRTNFDYYKYVTSSGQHLYSFNSSKLVAAIETVKFKKKTSHPENEIYLKDFIGSDMGASEYHYTGNNVVMIISPDITGNNSLPSYVINTIAAGDGTDRPFRTYFIKAYTTPDTTTAGKCLARMIGEAMGLAFEGAYDAPPNAAEPVQDIDKAKINLSPNILYLPELYGPPPVAAYLPPDDFKWRRYLSVKELENGLPVFSEVDQSIMSNTKFFEHYLGLWEGGGGFKNKVYRSGRYCLMGSLFSNDPNYSSHTIADVPDTFCPFCSAYIQSMLGRSSAAIFSQKTKNIYNQSSKFEEVNWRNKPEWNEWNPVGDVISINTVPSGVTNEYWNFNIESSSLNPLKITNIKVKGQQRPANRIFEDVMDYIDFTDLSVLFEGDTTPTPFPVSQVFTDKTFSREVTSHGQTLEEGDMYQWGTRVYMYYDFGGTCAVTVYLSVVFRSLLNDFDPGGAANALKFYPQIKYEWQPVGDNPKVVKHLNGTVRYKSSIHHAMTNPICEPSDRNFVELFADCNFGLLSSKVWSRKHKYISPVYPIPNPAPQWSLLFDHYAAMVPFADINQDVSTFQGVWGPEAPTNPVNKLQDRYAKGTYLPKSSGSTNNYKVWRAPRQGKFDNIHITGNMGLYDPSVQEVPIEGGPDVLQYIVAAPFCAEDCIHLHWRWGAALFGSLQSLVINDPKAYKGWDSNINFSTPHSTLYQPLIPPNQDLTVSIDATVPTTKIVNYKVTIVRPEAGSTNVILEQGVAYAARVASILPVIALFVPPINDVDPITDVDIILDDDKYEFMKKVYGRIRFSEAIDDNGIMQIVTTAIPNMGNSNHSSWLEDETNVDE